MCFLWRISQKYWLLKFRMSESCCQNRHNDPQAIALIEKLILRLTTSRNWLHGTLMKLQHRLKPKAAVAAAQCVFASSLNALIRNDDYHSKYTIQFYQTDVTEHKTDSWAEMDWRIWHLRWNCACIRHDYAENSGSNLHLSGFSGLNTTIGFTNFCALQNQE